MNTDYEVYIGLDWADQKHDLMIEEAGRQEAVHLEIGSKPEHLHDCISQLRHRHPQQRIAVCLEQKRGAVAYALGKYDFVDIYPINPTSFDQYRRTFANSGAKCDSADAALMLDFLKRHPDSLQRLEPDSVPMRKLRGLCEERRRTVDERTRLSNRLQSTLKQYYPQALELMGEKKYAPMALDFLEKWPSFGHLKKARKNQVENFFSQRRTSADLCRRAVKVRAESCCLTEDPAVVDTCILRVRHLLSMLRQLNATVHTYDKEIRLLEPQLAETRIFQSFPSSGPAMRPRLVAAFGSDRSRFSSFEEIKCFFGVAPVTQSSGRQRWVHWRWSCPKFLRQTMVEYAWGSTKSCEWARQYYDLQRSRGKSHQTALRALAYKWLKIMFRCWKNNEEYDENKYTQALEDRAHWFQKCA